MVYEATQLSLGRRVAIKVLPPAAQLDPRLLRRFEIEAQAAALLQHPHIVPVFAYGNERGVPYFAMRLIDGRNLAEIVADLRLSQRRGLPPGQSPSWAGKRPRRSTMPIARTSSTATSSPRTSWSIGRIISGSPISDSRGSEATAT